MDLLEVLPAAGAPVSNPLELRQLVGSWSPRTADRRSHKLILLSTQQLCRGPPRFRPAASSCSRRRARLWSRRCNACAPHKSSSNSRRTPWNRQRHPTTVRHVPQTMTVQHNIDAALGCPMKRSLLLHGQNSGRRCNMSAFPAKMWGFGGGFGMCFRFGHWEACD